MSPAVIDFLASDFTFGVLSGAQVYAVGRLLYWHHRLARVNPEMAAGRLPTVVGFIVLNVAFFAVGLMARVAG